MLESPFKFIRKGTKKDILFPGKNLETCNDSDKNNNTYSYTLSINTKIFMISTSQV